MPHLHGLGLYMLGFLGFKGLQGVTMGLQVGFRGLFAFFVACKEGPDKRLSPRVLCVALIQPDFWTHILFLSNSDQLSFILG